MILGCSGCRAQPRSLQCSPCSGNIEPPRWDNRVHRVRQHATESDFPGSDLLPPMLMLCSVSLTWKVHNNKVYLIGWFRVLVRVKIYKYGTVLAHGEHTMDVNHTSIYSFILQSLHRCVYICAWVFAYSSLMCSRHFKIFLLMPLLSMKKNTLWRHSFIFLTFSFLLLAYTL